MERKIDVNSLVEENKKRRDAFFSEYDPLTGVGSPIKRVPVVFGDQTIFVPKEMTDNPAIGLIVKEGSFTEFENKYFTEKLTTKQIEDFIIGFNIERIKYDFEFWAYTCVLITDKETEHDVPFKLRGAQRKLLKVFETDRINGSAIRVILLKCRQWGGSTLTQLYMFWIQLFHKKNWSSAIVADVDDQARNIRGMITKAAHNHPKDIYEITFKPFEGSIKNRVIPDRGCVVGIGSAIKPDNFRSYAFKMLHLSEVGLWKSTLGRSAEGLVQSLRPTVPPNTPYTMIVMESTAKGVGNFFHKEWQEAKGKKTGYTPVFVPWFEIGEMYQLSLEEEYSEFINNMNDYDWELWHLGATLEGINWYNTLKDKENYSDWRMKSEYPSTDIEAFQHTGSRVFAPEYVENARRTCRKPDFIGDMFANDRKGEDALVNLRFESTPGAIKNMLKVWAKPDTEVKISDRYCVFVDIGGRTHRADRSVIKVIDRYWMLDGGVPEVVATWHGHIDQDLLAWKAVQIATWYDNALLAIEVNSLRKDHEGSEGEHSFTVLDEIADYYDNLYARINPDAIRDGKPTKWGFHTNASTKPMIINNLNAALRDGAYTERDFITCDEMDVYEVKDNGSYGAVDGDHDDLVIGTAGALWLALCYMDAPAYYTPRTQRAKVKRRTAAHV